MLRFIIQAVVTALGLWLAAQIVPGVDFTSTGSLVAAAAEKDFGLGMLDDVEPDRAQHARAGRFVRHPPVGRITGIALLDEVEPGPTRFIEHAKVLVELVVGLRLEHFLRASLERLEQQQVVRHMLVKQVQRQ